MSSPLTNAPADDRQPCTGVVLCRSPALQSLCRTLGECWFRVTDAPVAAFAGIWRQSVEGKFFAFVTCEPNPLVAQNHPEAMPMILHRLDYNRYLFAPYNQACSLVSPFPSPLMSAL